MTHVVTSSLSQDLASFPDSPYVAYIVLTFELARTKSTACARLKVNIIYATWGESGNEATQDLGVKSNTCSYRDTTPGFSTLGLFISSSVYTCTCTFMYIVHIHVHVYVRVYMRNKDVKCMLSIHLYITCIMYACLQLKRKS